MNRRVPIVVAAIAALATGLACEHGSGGDTTPGDCGDLVVRYATQVQEALDFARERSGLEPTTVDTADRQGWLDWVRDPDNDDVPAADIAEDVATDLRVGYDIDDERQAYSAGLRIATAARVVDNCLDDVEA